MMDGNPQMPQVVVLERQQRRLSLLGVLLCLFGWLLLTSAPSPAKSLSEPTTPGRWSMMSRGDQPVWGNQVPALNTQSKAKAKPASIAVSTLNTRNPSPSITSTGQKMATSRPQTQALGARSSAPLNPVIDELTPEEIRQRAQQARPNEDVPELRNTSQDTNSSPNPSPPTYNQPNSPYANQPTVLNDTPTQASRPSAELLMYRKFAPKPYVKYEAELSTLRDTLKETLTYLTELSPGESPNLQRLSAYYGQARLDWLTLNDRVPLKERTFETYKLMEVAVVELKGIQTFWMNRNATEQTYRGAQEEQMTDQRVLDQRLDHLKGILDKIEIITKTNQTMQKALPYDGK